jgi:hypothetical protein
MLAVAAVAMLRAATILCDAIRPAIPAIGYSFARNAMTTRVGWI